MHFAIRIGSLIFWPILDTGKGYEFMKRIQFFRFGMKEQVIKKLSGLPDHMPEGIEEHLKNHFATHENTRYFVYCYYQDNVLVWVNVTVEQRTVTALLEAYVLDLQLGHFLQVLQTGKMVIVVRPVADQKFVIAICSRPTDSVMTKQEK